MITENTTNTKFDFGEKMEIVCYHCKNNFFLEKKTKNCTICGSSSFLIEGKYAIFAFAAKGGFGAVYKAGDIKVK